MRSLIPIVVLVAGCAGSGDRPRQTPDDAVPGKISLTVGNFEDTDQNRYLDSTLVTVYVWAASAAYPIPMRAKGTFTFELQDTRGTRLASWNFDAKQTAASMQEFAPGPGYIFELSLVGHDQINAAEGEVLCTFTPEHGSPVRARPSASLAIGPVARSRR